MRFQPGEKKFSFKEEWRKEDECMDEETLTRRELGIAMNSVNVDLKFTLESERDFQNGRLPTLGFEVWSEKGGLRHSFYEKPMRNQILTQKRSSQSESSKFSILTNELNRRFEMMDEKITEK